MKRLKIFKKKEEILESKKKDLEIREKRFSKKKEEKSDDERIAEEEKLLKEEKILKEELKLWREYVKKAAKDVANSFTYNQIIQAVKSSGFRGLEVYGYLELYHPDTWMKLLEDGIFDKACLFAQKKFEPEYISVLDYIDIKKYVKSPVIFKEELTFRNYPDRPFGRAVFYAPRPLREHIRWINNYRLYIDGYKSNVILGKVTLILLGWALPDFPQILVSFTPNQNQAIFEAQIGSDDLKYDTLDLLKKIIFYYRREGKVNEMKVLEAQMERERFEKRWSHLMDKMELEIPDDPKEAEFDTDRQFIKKRGMNFYKIGLITLGFSFLIVFIIFIFLFFGGN